MKVPAALASSKVAAESSIAALAKQGFDLLHGKEKQAAGFVDALRLGGHFGRDLGRRFFTAPPSPPRLPSPPVPKLPPAPRPAPAPKPPRAPLPPLAPREASLGRSALTLGGLGYGGALGAKHLSGGPTAGMSPEEQFSYHRGAENTASADLYRQVAEAQAGGDLHKANELLQQIEGGNYGGSSMNNMFTRTFLPWLAGDPNVSQHRNAAGSAQSLRQRDYDKAMSTALGDRTKFESQVASLQQAVQNPSLPPERRQLLQSQLAALQKRLSAPAGAESPEAAQIAASMRGAGMSVSPFGGGKPAPAAPTQPLSAWATQQRPPVEPGRVETWALNPYDFRHNAWEDTARNGGLRGNIQ